MQERGPRFQCLPCERAAGEACRVRHQKRQTQNDCPDETFGREKRSLDMNTFAKIATVTAVAGALAVPMATTSQAAWNHHHGHRGAAAAIGFGAGALIGAAAANAAAGPAYYDNGYGYDSYAYEPAPAYGYEGGYAYAPSYRGGYNPSNVREHRCNLSPGNPNYVPCENKF
jgi:hypothetical protein